MAERRLRCVLVCTKASDIFENAGTRTIFLFAKHFPKVKMFDSQFICIALRILGELVFFLLL